MSNGNNFQFRFPFYYCNQYPEIMETLMVRKSVSIKAEPEAVWKALTDPEKTKKYFFNCAVFSKWKIGSPITFTGRIFLLIKVELKGRILNIVKGRLLKYDLKNQDHSKSIVTERLSYDKGVTTLTVVDNVGTKPGAERRHKRSMKAWDKVLKGLKKLVEKEAPRHSYP